jgi:hypothetical protein
MLSKLDLRTVMCPRGNGNCGRSVTYFAITRSSHSDLDDVSVGCEATKSCKSNLVPKTFCVSRVSQFVDKAIGDPIDKAIGQGCGCGLTCIPTIDTARPLLSSTLRKRIFVSNHTMQATWFTNIRENRAATLAVRTSTSPCAPSGTSPAWIPESTDWQSLALLEERATVGSHSSSVSFLQSAPGITPVRTASRCSLPTRCDTAAVGYQVRSVICER